MNVQFSELAFHQHLVRPGILLDIGANVGEFSVPFSTWKDNRLIAFEPFKPVFDALRENVIHANGGMIPVSTTMYNAALGESVGLIKMRCPRRIGENDLSLHPLTSRIKTFEGKAGIEFIEFEIPMWTLDSLNLDDVTAIKLDAEGSENEVLEGADNTLSRCRPILSIELEERHRAGSTWYVPNFLQEREYDGWFFHQQKIWPISLFDKKRMQVVGADAYDGLPSPISPYVNTFLFIPKENDDLRKRLLDFGPIERQS